ncbi:hypothetical protein THRCLA_08002 [Thraustotheca clavata]|uniref:Blue (type 1) copper domain-containing protein n=1 Tax=Thraustotheca clavata TaxID=74557 RepID=A0A1V9ZBD6_9STRA|nr:hypothetical protein THRCLA_08002 [Thraustotheca clavata]
MIKIIEFQFNPSRLTIVKGDTIRWMHGNQHATLHSIIWYSSDQDEKLTFPDLTFGQSFTYTFNQLGTFQCYCYHHSFMMASITVIEKPSCLIETRVENHLRMSTFDAFVHAASLNQTIVLQRWINKGLSVDGLDKEQQTALCMAATNHCLEAMQLLLDHHANVQQVQKGNQTALHCAAMWGRLQAVELLLVHQAHVNSRDTSKQVPLHYASRNGHLDVVVRLLDAKADPFLANDLGYIPIEIAANWKRLDVVNALERISLQHRKDS